MSAAGRHTPAVSGYADLRSAYAVHTFYDIVTANHRNCRYFSSTVDKRWLTS